MRKILILTICINLLSTTANAVTITEVMPNPDGKDKNREWIELYNDSATGINLENWQIANKKTHTIKKLIIPAKSYIILENLKITLRNKSDEIRLLNSQGQIIDKIQYEKAPSGLSFSKINNRWTWGNPTKNKPNPIFREISGQISELTEGYFILDNKQKINFQNQINPEIKKTLLQKGASISALAEEKNNNYFLRDIQIKNPTQTKNSLPSEKWLYYILIPIILLMGAAITTSPSHPSPYK